MCWPSFLLVFTFFCLSQAGQEQYSHDLMVAYLDKWSDWNVWNGSALTFEQELVQVRRMKSEDCRHRLAERGDTSESKLFVFGNIRNGAKQANIPGLRASLARLPKTEENEEEEQLLRLRLGREYLACGMNEEALTEFLKLCSEAITDEVDGVRATSCLSDLAISRYSAALRELLGITYFRMAETANCVQSHNEDSCLMPIKEKAFHKIPRGAKAAIGVWEQNLRINPEDLGSMWLYNLAHQVLGRWPHDVDPRYLLSPKFFEAEYSIGRFYDISGPLHVGLRGLAGGAMFEDFDQDGFLDIMCSGSSARDQLKYFHNNGDGTFSDWSERAGLIGIVNGIDMSLTDYNNDGYPDPVMIRGGWNCDWWKLPNSLLRNNGDGTFTDITLHAGLWSTYASHSIDWADFNNDGFLDAFVANEVNWDLPFPLSIQPCQLFVNQGESGKFIDMAPEYGLSECPWTKSATWGDFNNDGLEDLYINNYLGPVEGHVDSRLYRNDGPVMDETGTRVISWRFTDVSKEAGIGEPKYGFPSFFFDWNNDGWLDLLISGFSSVDIWEVTRVALDPDYPADSDRPVLYQNNGDGTFTDVSKKMGHSFTTVMNVMGVNFGDLDNDGWQDVFFGTGSPDLRTLQPDRVLRNNRGLNFQDVTYSGHFGHLQKGHGISFGDVDNDGDQDIYVSHGAMYPADNFTDSLFLNPGHGNHWITIKTVGVKTNRPGIGVRLKVTVKTPSYPGGKRDIYYRVGVGGTFGTNSLQSEIGLGDATSIVSLVVDWPVSKSRQVFTRLALNSVIEVTEGKDVVNVLEREKIDFQSVVDAMIRKEEGSCGCGKM